MRRTIATVTTPGRWRRRRTARMALAAALVVAAPFVGRSDPADTPGPAVTATGTTSGADGHADATAPVRVVPIPLADPAVADLLQPGDLVDLVATDPADIDPPGTGHPGPAAAPDAGPPAPGPHVVARAARVRDIPTGRPGTGSVLVEVPEDRAAHLAATAATTPLAVVVHG